MLNRCPAETTYGYAAGSCVMTCPAGYEYRLAQGTQACLNKDDPDVFVRLVPQAAVLKASTDVGPFGIEDLDHASDVYLRYKAEKTRFNEELAAANLRFKGQKAIDAAARDVLAAGGNDATANARYSSLTHDPNALNVLYNADVRRATDKYISEYQFLKNQSLQQQQTLDLITNVKDNLLSVKDDVAYSVDTFTKQISDIRNQINVNKTTHQQATDYGKWMGVALNFAIVLALLFVVVVIGRKAMGTTSIFPSSSGQLGAPARPPASEHTIDLLKGLTGLLSASGDSAKKQ